MNVLANILDPYWAKTIVRVVAALAVAILVAGTLVYVYLFKAVSFMQSRLGPMEAGPQGSLQLLAEVGKFLQKEDIYPTKADRFLFKAAPYVVFMSTFLLVLVIPFGPDAWFADLDVGIYFALVGVVDLGHRHLDGGLVVGQQVLVARRSTRCRSADRL